MTSRESVGGPDAPRVAWWMNRRFLLFAVVVLLAAAVFGVGASRYTQSVPSLAPASAFPTSMTAAAAPNGIPWPAQGQAALSVDGVPGVLTHGTEGGAVPIASTTKVMTAVVILTHHPLQPGDSGPTVSITSQDVLAYEQAIAQDESTVGVVNGEKLTELQLMQGLLIASANNFADILAKWDSGSVAAFVQGMNAEAQKLGMKNSHFDDASGFSPRTTSTPQDLLLLARAGMAFPVFAGIVAQQEAEMPVVGTISNTNTLLGRDGVVGIKTGETDEAGDCLVFAADFPVNGQQRRVIGVLLGQPDRQGAFNTANELIRATPGQLTSTRVVAKGQSVGAYAAAWGGTIDAVAANDLAVDTWTGANIPIKVTLDEVSAPIHAGQKLGTLTATPPDAPPVSVDLVASGNIDAPGFWWRIIR